MLERVLDLGREGLHHRGGGRLVAEGQVARSDHRLDHRGQHPLGGDQASTLARRRRGRGREQALRDAEPLGHRPAGAPRDRLGADLGQTPGAEAVGLEPWDTDGW